jgi:hypothetical protein
LLKVDHVLFLLQDEFTIEISLTEEKHKNNGHYDNPTAIETPWRSPLAIEAEPSLEGDGS